jgi:hypothetical protein
MKRAIPAAATSERFAISLLGEKQSRGHHVLSRESELWLRQRDDADKTESGLLASCGTMKNSGAVFSIWN